MSSSILLLLLCFEALSIVSSSISSSASAITQNRQQYHEVKRLLSSHLASSTHSSSSEMIMHSSVLGKRRNVPSSSSSPLSSLAFSSHEIRSGRRLRHPLMFLSLRGGDIDSSDEDEDDESIIDMDGSEDDEIEEEGEEEEDSDDDDDDDDDESEEDESESEEEEDESESEEDEEEESDDESVSSTPLSSSPVKVIIRTGLKNILLDQSLELTCSRKRDVASLKTSVSKQLRGRPPPSTVRLLLGNRVLGDDELVDEIAPDEDEEDEHDDEDEEDDGDDEDMVKMHLLLDIVPPIDPKFATELPERMEKMSDSELLDAYVTNVIAMQKNNAELLKASLKSSTSLNEGDAEDEENENEETTTASIYSSTTTTTTTLPDSVSMRMDAMTMRERMLENFPEDVVKKLEGDTLNEEEGEGEEGFGKLGGVSDVALAESIKRKGRKNAAMKGGAKMNVKRSLQRNLNINWPDTIRNFFLFIFFGYFGGRNTASRTLMLFCAPMCFVIQARPVKIALKQLFYAVGKPPSIFLSLLPAPQQAIMSLDYTNALVEIYGEETARAAAEELGISLTAEDDDDDDDGFSGGDDDDDSDDDFGSDEYDDDY